MQPSRSILPPCVVVTLVTILASPCAAAPIRVELQSGRTFQGEIDPRSNLQQLWLKRGDAEASIARPIAWNKIAKAFAGDEPIAISDLKQQAVDLQSPALPAEPIAQPQWRGVFAIAEASADAPTIPLPQVRSVDIEAFHANWDADVESDGLVVIVYPLDADGQIVPVSGSLEVELIAPEVRRFQDAPQGRGLTLERIGQWTAAIHPQDFSASGYRVELPFQALHPEFDTKILPHGLVHARLVVPGQGTFDATEEFLRIRPWSPLRDQYWRDTGRRFFPNERTGRPKRSE
jgi:hypothetical protein